MDHIFKDEGVKVIRDEKRFEDSMTFENYLDKHRKELEEEQQKGPRVHDYGPRSGLADWNRRMDREFGLDDNLIGGRNRRSTATDDQNDVLNLDVQAQMSRAQIESNKESAVKPGVIPEPVKKDEMEELRKERERML